jgi:hypothetical protein
MSYSDDSDNKYSIGAVASGVLGFAFAQFVGIAAFVPFIVFGLVFLLLHKAEYEPESLRPSLALQSAQLGWFIVGALVIPGGFMAAGADIAIGLALLLWLVFSRHWLPLALICLMQLFGIFVNFQALSDVGYSGDAVKPMLVHIAIRMLIVGTAAYFFFVKYMDGENDGIVDDAP